MLNLFLFCLAALVLITAILISALILTTVNIVITKTKARHNTAKARALYNRDTTIHTYLSDY